MASRQTFRPSGTLRFNRSRSRDKDLYSATAWNQIKLDLTETYRNICRKYEDLWGWYIPRAYGSERITWEAFGLACDLYNSNYSLAEIEEITGFSRYVFITLRKFWFPELIDATYSKPIIGGRRQTYSSYEIDKVKQLIKQGVSNAEIVKEFPDRTVGQIQGLIFRIKKGQYKD